MFMTFRKWRSQGTRAARAPAGFTIMEILVALTLLAIVILLVTRAFLTVLTVTSQGGRLTVATALAAKKLEEFRTQVEAQPTRESWRNEFCAIVTEPVTPFRAPYAAYSYRVALNQDAVAAAPGQEDVLLPCWSVEWARGGCSGPGYTPEECATNKDLAEEDRLRWVTVEVYFRGGNAPVVRMTTAIMRGAYHRTD